jgi:hypothetical protein
MAAAASKLAKDAPSRLYFLAFLRRRAAFFGIAAHFAALDNGVSSQRGRH